MASLTIKSDLPNFSFAIKKNPATGMIAKSLRQGSLYGWYSAPDTYNCLFLEGNDEISFKNHKDDQYSITNINRYNHPLIIASILKTFFSSSMNSEEEDFNATVANYTMTVNQVYIKKPELVEYISKCFEKSANLSIVITPIDHVYVYKSFNEYKLIVSGYTSLYKFFNACYLLSYLISCSNCSHPVVPVDVLGKVIKIANLFDLPYYIRYLIKIYMINNKKDYNTVKDLLEQSSAYAIKLDKFDNQSGRYDIISKIIFDYSPSSIIDFGCGKGYYLKLLSVLKDTIYIGIDNDIEALEAVSKKARKLKYSDRVSTYKSIEQMKSNVFPPLFNLVFLMSEVFEHNSLDYNTSLLKQVMELPHCDKIIITTPNRDFNSNYPDSNRQTRIDDHVFEMSKAEAVNYFTDIVNLKKYCFKIIDVGDKVNNVSTTLMIVISKI